MARNLATEYRKTLQAQHDLAPMQYMDEAQFQPLYQSLNLKNIDTLLNGTGAQDYTYYDWNPAVYSNTRRAKQGSSFLSGLPGMPGGDGGGFPGLPGGSGGFSLPGLPGGSGGFPGLPGMGGGGNPLSSIPGLGSLFGGSDKPKRKLLSAGHYTGRTVTNPAQRGLLQMYEQDIAPSQARQVSFQRQSDINDVRNLSPAFREAMRTSDPTSAKLLDSLSSDAQEGMDLGATLDPSLRREVSQSVRAGQSARGMGMGPVDAYIEAMQTGSAAEALRATRRANAANAVQMNQGFYGNAMDKILNRSNGNGALGTAQLASQIGGQAGAKDFNPESAYASDLYNTNFNAAIAQAINAKNNQTALIGAGISAVGGIAGGALGAI